MNTAECNKCGKSVLSSTIIDGRCMVCRSEDIGSAPNEASKQNVESTGSSSQQAIDVLRSINAFNLACGTFIAIVLMVLAAKGGVFFALGGLIFMLVTLVSWSVIRVYVGIAEDVKAIRRRLD